MTEKLRQIMLRQSETREALNAEAAKDTPDDGKLAELRTKAQTIEGELRAALAEPDPEPEPGDPAVTVDAETRERREIRTRTGIGDFLRAAAGGREVNGAAAEYAAACGVSTMQRLPLAIFRDGRPETRAITPGPGVDGAVQAAVPYVFERSAAVSLGVQMPVVGPGSTQIPRLTTAPPADTLAKDAAAPSTAAAISLDSQSPKRIAGQFEVRVEDLAVYPALEDVLGEAIRGALGDELDEQAFNGTNAGGDLNGLFKNRGRRRHRGGDRDLRDRDRPVRDACRRQARLLSGGSPVRSRTGDVRGLHGPFPRWQRRRHVGRLPHGEDRIVPGFRIGCRRSPATDRRGSYTLNAGPSPIRIHVWNALEIVRDPYSGAGSGKVTITATALLSDAYVPHTTSQVKEIHPKIS